MRHEAQWTLRVIGIVKAIAPAMLAFLSGYCLLLLIGPFFLLEVSKVPMLELVSGRVDYEKTFGPTLMVVTIVLFARGIALYVSGTAWLVAISRLVQSRERWLFVLCLMAPIPIGYYYFGPDHLRILEWLLFD